MADRHRHFVRPLAEQDIAEIWTYGTERWGADQADRYFDAMVNLFDLLSEQPEIARLRDEFSPPVRIHPYGSHVVVGVCSGWGRNPTLRVLSVPFDYIANGVFVDRQIMSDPAVTPNRCWLSWSAFRQQQARC